VGEEEFLASVLGIRDLARFCHFKPADPRKPTPGLEPGTPSLRVKRVYSPISQSACKIDGSALTPDSVQLHRTPQRSSDVFQRCSN